MMKNKTLSSIVLIIFGVLIAVWPGATSEILARLFGLGVLVYGAIGVVQFLTHGNNEGSTIKSIFSAVLVIVGILILTNTSAVIAIVPIIIGVCIALSGALNGVTAFRHKDEPGFKRDMILAVVTLALGIIIFANPFSTAKGLMIMVGLTLIYLGVTRLVAAH